MSMKRFPAIGITGGIGCGKSEVGRLLSGHGVAVLDADDVVHRMMEPGTPTHAALIARFGARVAGPDGRIDRPWLARLVFESAGEREALHAILHPPVLAALRKWVEERRAQGPVAVQVPLLFEVGFRDPFDAVICVAAEPGVVRERLKSRGWSDREMQSRLAAQWPLEEKMRRADVVIWNNGTLAELAAAVEQAWNELRERSR